MGAKKMNFILGFLGLLFLDSLLLCMARKVHYYDFVLKDTNFTRMCSTKSMLTVNGSFPGPTIRVHKGDTVYVNVHNHGTYGVTIHWHGVSQPRNPWSDGPENITQCPILPGTNFTQEVIFTNEEGTLWWHAHSSWTRATVHGAIVILPAAGTVYPYPKPHAEQTIVLASWFKGDVQALIEEATLLGAGPNNSDGYTINGQPGDLYPCSNASTYRYLVEYGKTYLLRIINAVMNEDQFFAIAGHNLTVVGQDGAYLKPIKTSYIMISAGQTMDVLVTANQTPSYYYMASSAFADAFAQYDNTTTTAIFQYKGHYTRPSSILFPSVPSYNNTKAADNFTTRLRSLASKKHPIKVPKKITTRIFITVSVNELTCPNNSCALPDGNRPSASLNNISFATPTIDILQAYYRNLSGVYNKTFPSRPPFIFNFTGDLTNMTELTSQGTKVKLIKYGEAVEIVFQGTDFGAAENHPIHLHGYSFYLVGSGYGNFNNVTDPKSYNLDDPPFINTFGTPKNGWATIRFIADNPGVWFMHCHLERHATWGMDTVLIVQNGPTKATSIRKPPAYMPPCSGLSG